MSNFTISIHTNAHTHKHSHLTVLYFYFANNLYNFTVLLTFFIVRNRLRRLPSSTRQQLVGSFIKHCSVVFPSGGTEKHFIIIAHKLFGLLSIAFQQILKWCLVPLYPRDENVLYHQQFIYYSRMSSNMNKIFLLLTKITNEMWYHSYQNHMKIISFQRIWLVDKERIYLMDSWRLLFHSPVPVFTWSSGKVTGLSA